MCTKRKFPTCTKSKSGLQFTLRTFHIASKILGKENSGKRGENDLSSHRRKKEKVMYPMIGLVDCSREEGCLLVPSCLART